jgi:hypothetical protein
MGYDSSGTLVYDSQTSSTAFQCFVTPNGQPVTSSGSLAGPKVSHCCRMVGMGRAPGSNCPRVPHVETL